MNEWTSCNDKLPEEKEICLLYQTYPSDTLFNLRADPIPSRTVIVIGGLRSDDKFVAYHDQWSEEGLKYVTHWMPIPKGPNE